MNKSITIVLVALFSIASAQTAANYAAETSSWNAVSCSATKLDTACAASATIPANSCCATVVQSVKATAAATTVTNTTNNWCMPAEIVKTLGTVVVNATLNMTYSCPATSVVSAGTPCTSNSDCGNTTNGCCASRGAVINSSNATIYSSNVCASRLNYTAGIIYIAATTAPAHTVTYTRYCLESSNAIFMGVSAISAIISAVFFF